MTCNADSSKCVTQSDKKKETGGKGNGYSGGCGSFHSLVIVVSANGILSYQKAVTKKTFGGWFIMENSSNGTQSEELKTHPYLAGAESCEYGSIQ